MYRFLTYLSYILGSGFGSGYAPVAPGTVGSVAAALFWIVCATWLPPIGVAAELILVVFSIFLAIAVTNHCLTVGPFAQKKDPQQIVIDEWAGLFVSFILLTPQDVAPLMTSFALFRLFDGWKPRVIDWVQGLPKGYGVVADDILAGLTARLIVFFIWRL
jgi:phosphatidylglycerophosphatase A